MRKLVSTLALACIVSSPLAAIQTAPPSVTGSWSGSIVVMKDGKAIDEDPMLTTLKQQGDMVTGTTGPSAQEQYAIAKGRVATVKGVTTLTFELAIEKLRLVINYDLTVSGNDIKGKAVAVQEGQKFDAVVSLKRAK